MTLGTNFDIITRTTKPIINNSEQKNERNHESYAEINDKSVYKRGYKTATNRSENAYQNPVRFSSERNDFSHISFLSRLKVRAPDKYIIKF